MAYVPNNSQNIVIGDTGVGSVGSKRTATVNDTSNNVSRTINFLQNPSLAGASALYGEDIFPFRNELNQFASYAPIFTLGCLTNLELNFPLSYRTLGPLVKIIRSGGGGGPTIPSLYDLDGKREFFIEDVTIKNTVAPTASVRHTNATNINFKVIEPYSMGQFYHNLRSASLVTGHSNYLDAPFLISVAFIGYDDEGNVKSPFFSQRHFPIQIVEAEMEVTESGAVYTVKAVPYTERAVTNRTQKLKSDVQITGRTVAEILQVGPNSLTTQMNKIGEEQKEAGNQDLGDRYVIQFPNTGILGGAVSAAVSAVSGALTAQLGSIGSGINGWYQGLVGNTDTPAGTKTMAVIGETTSVFSLGSLFGNKLKAEAEVDINEIGRSVLIRQGTTANAGQQTQQIPSLAESQTVAGTVDRTRIVWDENTAVMSLKTGDRVEDIIEEVIISSEYGRDFARANADMAGRVKWFRIETQTYNTGSLLGGIFTGSNPKVYVYRVRVFKYDGSTIAAPGVSTFSKSLIKQLLTPKAYSYIYTGANDDIIDLDLKFNHVHYSGIQAARNQKTLIQQLGGALGFGPKDRDPVTKAGIGVPTGAENSRLQDDAAEDTERQGASGSTGSDDAATGTARYFNQMVINSSEDLIKVDLTIHGDPYFIMDVGTGNYLGLVSSPLLPVTLDGSCNPMDGEVYVILNFRTPIDYGPDGYVEYPLGGFLPLSMFSGLYSVVLVESTFEKGKFVQKLTLTRKRNQDISIEALAGKVISFLRGGNGAAQDLYGTPASQVGDSVGPDEELL
jgi:hypothetical protein